MRDVTPERWRQVREVFHSVLELEPRRRAEYLSSACATDDELRHQVESLLEASEDAEDFIEAPALASDASPVEEGASAMVGRRIGPYEVKALVGEGGMGAVYRAVRADDQFHQEVAIKLVKRGMDTDFILRRFRTERQILARLDHPNIARLQDGGVTGDGLPYFVMEFLEGQPILDYCESRKLSAESRLRLFLPVCAAVHYAHQNLVVHRDIKANNILVGAKGVPKLLDFGIAKLLDRDSGGITLTNPTGPGMRMMTPDYASPEQMRGGVITTATDVYSLGVLLYELLSGRRPFALAGRLPHEMARVIAEDDPPRPGTVRPISADLDNIVLMAMHKDPQRRYPSAEALADDIRRHLKGLPVLAREATIRYRAGKFLRRHRTGVIAAGLALVAVFAGGASTLWQAGVAAAARSSARAHLYEVRELANSFMYEIDGALVGLSGSTRARDLLVKRVVQYLDTIARDSGDPALRHELATAYEKMGDVQGGPKSSNLGDSQAAFASYRKSLDIFEALAAGDPANHQLQRDLSRGYHKLADVIAVLGDSDRALEYDTRALAIREALLAADPQSHQARQDVAFSYHELAGTLSIRGEWDMVYAYRWKAYEMLKELAQSDPNDASTRRGFALAAKRLGRILIKQKRVNAALPYFAQALEIEQLELRASPADPAMRLNVTFTYHDIGAAHFELGHYGAALENYQKALTIREELAAADPKDARTQSTLAMTHYRIGMVLLRTGQPAAALDSFRLALQIRQALAAVDTASAGARGEVAEALAGVGDAYAALGRREEARSNYQRALAHYTELLDKKRLSASHTGEPGRIAAALKKL